MGYETHSHFQTINKCFIYNILSSWLIMQNKSVKTKTTPTPENDNFYWDIMTGTNSPNDNMLILHLAVEINSNDFFHTTYTSGQRYRITTTKWHLREFDRYLLFLVVCSIAERNTVDSIDPLRNQIECQTQSVLSGDRWDSREGKSEFRDSHLNWILPSPYHFDAFVQLGVSVKTIDIFF